MEYLFYFIIFNISIYNIGLLWFIIGIIKSKKINFNENNLDVSIIVCVKNGELSLPYLLNDLHAQVYNSSIEFIIVDDNSSDKSKKIIQDFSNKDERFKYVHSSLGAEKLKYKKRALDAGIMVSKFDILLFTDIDCRVSKDWVSSMINNFNNNIDYVIGYSQVLQGKKFVSKFQQIDFMMLMFAALGSTSMGAPIASTGQNQAYKKNLYETVGGFNKITNLIQGDDSIFLNICRNFANANVAFSINENSYVKSRVHDNWKDFLSQRSRWAGDANIMWKFNKPFYLFILVTFIVNLGLLISPLFYFVFPRLFIFTIISKLLLELLIYLFGVTKLHEKFNLILFIKWFFVQILYIVIMGFLSFFQKNIKWREK